MTVRSLSQKTALAQKDMLSYAFMKILEMRPRSYDRRMDLLSRGRVRALKTAAAEMVEPGGLVLEIGCGTGELADLLIKHKCRVSGFDVNPSMVAAARRRIEAGHLEDRFEVKEMGVEGMDGLPGESFDAVVSTLVFSELSADERRFALKHAARVLKSGGRLIIADEVVPPTPGARWLQTLFRLPVTALAFLISGQSSRPLGDLPGEMAAAGFVVIKEIPCRRKTLSVVLGRPAIAGRQPE